MNDTVRQFRDFFVSLRLTVVLLVLSMILVFAATIDQVNLGVWGIQQKWFHSAFVLQDFRGIPVPIFPGGYLIGGFLLVNLLTAHVYRFKFAWRKTGILLTHLGLILLLVGELLSGLLQEDYSMRLEEGQTRNYSESYRNNELAIIETTNPAFDDVVAVPEKLLADRTPIQHPALPFRLVTREYYPNTDLRMRTGAAAGENSSMATTGIGPRIVATPLPLTYKQDERNIPTTFVELIGPEGTLGIWLVSPQLPAAQSFDYAGRSWRIGMRAERAYKPFSLTLLKFTHDVYVGTEIPKNYSSLVRLTAPGQADREVAIYMNNPLRYAGLTFYQASFEQGNDHVTILQVVRNPSWLMPYISCVTVALGLVIQFGIHLAGFIRKRRSPRLAQP